MTKPKEPLDELLELKLERLNKKAKEYGVGWAYKTGRIGDVSTGPDNEFMYETVILYIGLRRRIFRGRNAIAEALFYLATKYERDGLEQRERIRVGSPGEPESNNGKRQESVRLQVTGHQDA